ncbi:FecR domain-containing protein [Sphaerotilus sp.]|uniref:FecR domain-containing protein n=1 Tax=Sphaerotilus sp. TaxID=2093942 RepID=UPI00286E1A04|nr:FecR domain-containing protein [Sphaerotilus sp.]
MTALHRPITALLALLLSAAGSLAADATDEFLYTVQPGDSAWTVAARYLRDPRHWNELRLGNQLPGDRLRPGQVLRIPMPWLRLTTPEARLTALQGDVMLNSGAGWTTARPDTLLPPGTWLRTATAGTATLLLQDGTRVLVRPASELRLVPVDAAQLNAWLKAQSAPRNRAAAQPAGTAAPVCIELLRGGLENAVQPQSGQSRFEVRTPSAVTTVRGTEFRISADGDSSRAEVVHGAVAFGNPLGQVELGAATGSRAGRGAQPAAAVPLLPAPDLQSVAEQISPDRLQALTLPALVGAVAYRTQWLADETPARLLHENVTEAPQPGDPSLPDGRYRLRVRGIDAVGFEGLSAERTLAITTPLPPPPPPPAPPPAPSLDARRTGQRLALHWSPVAPQAWSQMQVALEAGFTSVVLDEPTPLDHLTLPLPVRPGPLHIRVRVLQPGGGRSGWSEPRVFDPRSPQEPTP